LYAIPWAQIFVSKLKQQEPGTKVVCGGRWVVDHHEAWIRSRVGADVVVTGFGEKYIARVFGLQYNTQVYPPLNYALMPDYLEYPPSIETSRGCGRGCSFCVEQAAPWWGMRNPNEVVSQLTEVELLYGPVKVRPFLEASLFQPDNLWISDFLKARQVHKQTVQWRTETRVDVLNTKQLETLACAGLKVLDLGLESASSTQLLKMNKTRRPDIYLHRASNTLQACYDLGIWPKLNIVLYAGENNSTLRETIDWLNQYASLIKGISINPVIYYPESFESNLPAQLVNLGATLTDHRQLKESGFANINLSNSLSYEKALDICLQISRQIMTARDFYDLKMFGYFSPTLTLNEFMTATNQSDQKSLPFKV